MTIFTKYNPSHVDLNIAILPLNLNYLYSGRLLNLEIPEERTAECPIHPLEGTLRIFSTILWGLYISTVITYISISLWVVFLFRLFFSFSFFFFFKKSQIDPFINLDLTPTNTQISNLNFSYKYNWHHGSSSSTCVGLLLHEILKFLNSRTEK